MDKSIDGSYVIALYDKLSTPPAWMDSANCVEVDNVDILFSPKKMKKLCNECPVAILCYQWAIDNELEKGVFGGVDFSSLQEDDILDKKN